MNNTVSFTFLDIDWEISLEGQGDDMHISEIIDAYHLGDCGGTVRISQQLLELISNNWEEELTAMAIATNDN